MELTGKTIKSKAFGIGEITKANEQYVFIKFDIEEKQFPYTSFIDGKFLLAEDSNVQDYCEEKGRKSIKPKEPPVIPRPIPKPSPKPSPKPKGNTPKISSHKGRGIFWVFQGKEFEKELADGYIWAPYKDSAGNEPFHWAMLENIKAGDIIIHGLAQCISAISVAKGGCFDSKIKDGVTLGRQVNCKPLLIKNTIATRQYRDDIIDTCSKYKYQPFDKNGNGRMGYLFDLNDELAGIFVRALVNKNPTLLSEIPELNDVIKL